MLNEPEEIQEYMDLRFLIFLDEGKKLRSTTWPLHIYIQVKDIPCNYYLPVSIFSKRSIKMFSIYNDEVSDIKDYFLTAYDLFEANWVEYLGTENEKKI